MSYIVPVRRILTESDLLKWKASKTHDEYTGFIETLAASVKGKANDAVCEKSPAIDEILNILEEVEKISERHPVIQDANTSRFGKVEFRDFYDEVTKVSKTLFKKLTNLSISEDDTSKDPRTELAVYFNESWGNRTRIDYGSGHEMNFMCFLLCLVKLEVLSLQKDSTALILKVFIKYLSLMRTLQQNYWLEPAGSHGVWGLDDYHFLPFLFGASQLATHPHLRPKSIHNSEYVVMFKDKFLYFHCVWFINKVKTASLRWHSPLLDDISGAKNWSKVAEGMVKMYKAEVLNKLPIIQHFFFGNILKAPEGDSPIRSSEHQHDESCSHNHTIDPDSDEGLPGHTHTWGDCCGIRLPSAIAAHELDQTTKVIPFD